MKEQAGFTLRRAGIEDVEEMVQAMFDAFDEFTRQYFMGCYSADDLPKLVGSFARQMAEDPTDIWMVVSSEKDGKIVAVSRWKLYLGPPSSLKRPRDEPHPWLDEGAAQLSRAMMHPQYDIRQRELSGPFLHLHICITRPEYQRQGAGKLLLQWGNKLADTLSITAWVEATPAGRLLYSKHGFGDVEKIYYKGEHIITSLRREPGPNVL